MKLRVAVLLAVAAAAPAQEEHHVSCGPSARTPKDEQVAFDVLVTGGARRLGGYGWVTVDARNPVSATRDIELRIEEPPGWRSRYAVRIEHRVRLAGGARQRVVLPLPATTDHIGLHISVDGHALPAREVPRFPSSQAQNGPATLVVSSREATLPVLRGPVEAAHKAASAGTRSRRGRRATPPIVVRRPADLPERWWFLSGFDLVVVDGAGADMTAARQTLLARYMRGGGSALITSSASLRDGALKDLTRAAAGSSGRHGLGTWFATPEPPRAGDAGLQDWLTDKVEGPLRARSYSGAAHSVFHTHLQLPGLGDVPVVLFFLLILGFAIVVGPINFFVFQRRLRRPMLLLVTVPGAGLGLTTVILTWGLLSEGFGIKGAGRSLTILDQRNHEGVTLASDTLYAGLSPAELRPAPGTSVFASDLMRGRRNGAHVLGIDVERGVIDGALLPSRTPTAIVSVSCGRARERLRFRRAEDGALEVLAGPDMVPQRRAASLVYRDDAGRYWINGVDGRMHPARATEAVAALKELRTDLTVMPIDLSYGYWSRRTHPEDWIARKLGSELDRGTYLARVEHVPSRDDLGLTVEWSARQRLVLGRLAEEDVVD